VAAVGGGLMATPIAHAGHWASTLLYAAPILVVIAALIIQRLRDRR